MPHRPEPLQTTRMLAVGFAMWFLYALIWIIAPQPTSSHLVGLLTATTWILLYGGLLFLGVGMFLRATAWAQSWRDGTDGPYDVPIDVVMSENPTFPAEDDPDF